ncbi:hypothetical protein CSV63_07265 [Sporosarcina sp. P34]|uniref:hypothetical protein n=1 Tax=Sporosarcina sp. P34 TaxID=2048247 RepID=UPI000C1708A3|nr:hypothetical protein [Sporosarcina sp. P34]PID15573.1 hypothetical protein CSV63_07265 [Sporosarcina sp. P34]
MNEEEVKKLKDKLRSGSVGRSAIRVIYLGRKGGWHYGKVIEAIPRHVQKSGLPYPFPKWRHCDYRIVDEDGDPFPISEHGTILHDGFYFVPDDFEI